MGGYVGLGMGGGVMNFYAICDTDLGRHEPKPMARHIYSTYEMAKQAAEHRGFAAEYYPILPVTVKVAA